MDMNTAMFKRKPILITIVLIIITLVGALAYYLINNNGVIFTPVADLNYTPITFDEIASSPERTPISNQYTTSHGITFSGQGNNSCAPRLCKEGSPGCGFSYQGGVDASGISDGAAPIKAPGRPWTPNFLGMNDKCVLVIDFAEPTTKFSFDVLDVDTAGSDREAWRVETYSNGTLVGEAIVVDKTYIDNLYPGCRECGDGRSTPVNIERTTTINQIKVSPVGNDNSFGLGFDNFTPFSIPSDPDPLVIEKSSVVTTAANTATINYSLVTTNPNSTTASNVLVLDNLPAEVVTVTNISNNGVYDATNKTILWDVPSLAPGGSITTTFTATFNVPNNSSFEVTNEGIVYIDLNDDNIPTTNEEQNSDSVTDPLAGPVIELGELNITKTSTSVEAGTSVVITYGLAIQNTYTTAKVVNVKDNLDSKVLAAWVSEISNTGSLATGIISWNNLSIPASGNLSLTYKVTIPNTEDGTYDNIAILYDTNNIELDRDDESITITPTAEVGTMNITKTSTAVTQLNAHSITYRLTIQNTFPSSRTGLKVIDTLDTKVLDSWVETISNSGTVANKVITWNNLTVPANQSLTLTYVVTIPTGNPGTYKNIAVLFDSTNTEIDRDDETISISPTNVSIPVSTPLPVTSITDGNYPFIIIGVLLMLMGGIFIKMNSKESLLTNYSNKILNDLEKRPRS